MFINNDDQTAGIGIPVPDWIDGKKLTSVADGLNLDDYEMNLRFRDFSGYGTGV